MEEKEFLFCCTPGDPGFSSGAVCFEERPSDFIISSICSLNTHWNTRLVGELSPSSLFLLLCSPGDSARGEIASGFIEDDWPSSHAPLESSILLSCSSDGELALDELLALPGD